jgi:hypothetical protein
MDAGTLAVPASKSGTRDITSGADPDGGMT